MSTQTVKSGDIVLHGYCLPKYERLRDAFLRNFRELGEVGASYAVMVGGEMVVDLWAGPRDEAGTTPWDTDTVACSESAPDRSSSRASTKGCGVPSTTRARSRSRLTAPSRLRTVSCAVLG